MVAADLACAFDGEVSACWGGGARDALSSGALVHGATGAFGTCVVRRDGAVLCATGGAALRPVDVTDARAVAVGEEHACALRAGGGVACWGANGRGQLGDGTTEARSSPVPVRDLEGVRAISAAAAHTCAVLDDGAVACWGGYPSVDDVGSAPASAEELLARSATAVPPAISTPRRVPGVADASAIAASAIETCAVVASRVRCWPAYVGEGARVASVPWPDDVVGLAMGGSRGCALRGSGTIACWGSGSDARARPEAPSAVRGLDGAVAIAVDASRDRPCALSATGRVACAEPDGSIVTLGSLGDSGY